MPRQLLAFNSVSTCCNYKLPQSRHFHLAFIGQHQCSNLEEQYVSICVLVLRRGWGRSCLVLHKESGCRRRGVEAGQDITAGLNHSVKPEPPLERSDQSWRCCQPREPGEGGRLLVPTLPDAKRVDGKPGSGAFFMGCWTVTPVKSHWLGTGRYRREREPGRPQGYPVCLPGSPHWTAAKVIL